MEMWDDIYVYIVLLLLLINFQILLWNEQQSLILDQLHKKNCYCDKYKQVTKRENWGVALTESLCQFADVASHIC